MSERPLISVLVAAYNCEDTVRAALMSALEGTTVPMELIAVDDGSTDSTPTILDEISADDPRVTVIHNEANLGPGVTRNVCLDNAHGEWLMHLDADDAFEPGALNELADTLRETSADVVFFNYSRYDVKADRKWFDAGMRFTKVPANVDLKTEDVVNDLIPSLAGLLWPRAIRADHVAAHKLRFMELPRTEDVYFAMGATVLAEKVRYADIMVYVYSVNQGASSTDTYEEHALCATETYKEVFSLLEDNGLWRDGYKDGFYDYLVNSSIFHLTRCTTYAGYSELATELVENVFPLIRLDEAPEEIFFIKSHYEYAMQLWKEGVEKGLPSLMRVYVKRFESNQASFLKERNINKDLRKSLDDEKKKLADRDDRITELEHELEDGRRERGELKRELADGKRKLSDTRRELKEREQEIRDVRGSLSMKVGRAATALPRFVRDMAKRKKEHKRP